jgi:hypothetical protein
LGSLSPDQREEYGAVARATLRFGLIVLGAFIGLIAPLPWPALGAALIPWAVVVGLRTLPRARRLPASGGTVAPLVGGLALAAFMTLYAVSLGVRWPVQWDFQQCQAQALTVEAQDQCLAQYQEDTANLISRLQAPPR